MDNKNALENLTQNQNFFDFSEDVDAEESFDFDELESKLEEELETQIGELDLLKEEKEKIGSPDALGETIKGIVWEQFINQIAVTAGEDFIKENNGLHLDLRKDAHIQTTENFANGKIATHNTEINYQERYNDWQSNFVKDENGNVVTHKTRFGKEEATLVKGAREPFDRDRPSGSTEKHTDMDHTISAAEIIRDPEANAHMTKDEQIAFANSEANLNEMDSSLNRSKGDKSMSEWLDNPNANGQKPDEIFDISAEDEAKMRQKDAEAREEYEKQKKDAEQKSIEAGKKSRKEEAFRIGGKALRAVLMQLLAELVKEIIGKLVKWFKESQKNLKTLLSSIKEAILSFISKLKTHIINAGNTVVTTIATAIVGPIFGLIKKVWAMLKQGWKALKDAIAFLRDPNNKNMPFDRKLMEVGKIVIAGFTGVGALLLGEIIEKGLMALPGIGAVFAFEIPLLGSLASLLGVFLGAVVAGIIGAIAINLIQKRIEKKQKEINTGDRLDKGNEILETQEKLLEVLKAKTNQDKVKVATTITQRHNEAATIIKESVSKIIEEDTNDEEFYNDVDDMSSALNNLLKNN